MNNQTCIETMTDEPKSQTMKTRLVSQPMIFDAVKRERIYQDRKHGPIEQHGHTVAEWLMIMQLELDEAKLAWAKSSGDDNALREALQVVATGIACFEQHGFVERENLHENV